MSQSVSIIIPVYNEEEILSKNVFTLLGYLETNTIDYEIVLVENGSKDRTLQFSKELEDTNKRIKLVSLLEPSLGGALKNGIIKASKSNIVYFPIDLSVNLSFILESIKLLENNQIVVGSKKLKTAKDNRSLTRKIVSSCYHRTVQILFQTDISDTTCVKAYKREIALDLMNAVPSNSSIFETEILLNAQRAGLSIIQIPVTVNDMRAGRISLKNKISSKSQDLLSIRIDLISFIFGVILFLLGFSIIVFLSIQKLLIGNEGFLNPYSFLISMLLILFGVQGISYGLFARLFLQLRKEIIQNNSRHTSGNLFKEEGS
jgi:glycosyltransferase involved in cell wall biosynthesis